MRKSTLLFDPTSSPCSMDELMNQNLVAQGGHPRRGRVPASSDHQADDMIQRASCNSCHLG
jgi:hypothetical protein